MNDFETFLGWEARSHDTIDFKKTYVDMSGDVVAGLMLSQIIYWYLPNSDGDEKLRVEKEGEKWLVKSRDDWWAECRISPREADRARKNLESRGIIEVRVFKFNGSPTQHLRILKDRFLELWQKAVDENRVGPRRKSKGDANGPPKRPKSLKSPFSRNGEMDLTNRGDGFHRNGEMDFTNRGVPRTETTAKNTSETTAASGYKAEARHADAGLIQELVSKGVGRKVAEQLAREKPGICRQYLEYLPFVKLRSSPGAWLANAIRDEYGPPEGYVEAQDISARHATSRPTPRETAHQDIRRTKLMKLRAAYDAMETSNAEGLAAFNRYLEAEKCRLTPMTRLLSETRRHQLLAAFDDLERRMELFERWLESGGSDLVAGNESALI